MRKMSTAPAIIAGVFYILNMLIKIVSGVITLIQINGNPTLLGSTIGSMAGSVISSILLAVVLFMGRKNIFAAVIFILNALGGVLSTVSGVFTLFSIRNIMGGGLVLPHTVGLIGDLFMAVVFALMAVECFKEMGMKPGIKMTVFGVGMAVSCVLSAVSQYMSIAVTSGAGSHAAVLAGTTIIMLVPGFVAVILAGVAMGGGKKTAPVQPMYPQYPPQQFQYQAPQYQQPQYQAPQYQQPQYQAPQYQQPQYQAPQYQQPQYQAPQQPGQEQR